MSGWIKMGTGLRDHPKVVRMAGMLKSDCLRVVGALHAVWSIFDEHSPDGLLEFYTLRVMDEKLGWKGFSQAMQSVGWLVESESGLEAPDYEEHNGQSAKRRAMESTRKAASREMSGDGRTKTERVADWDRTKRGHLSASDADKERAREEKRREEKENPLPLSVRFHEFWTSWPRSPRKGAKPECLKLWTQQKLDEEAEAILAHVKAMSGTDGWTKQAGEFIPAPAVYLRQRRWDGAEINAGCSSDDIFAGAK
jgi:hypothetical protein